MAVTHNLPEYLILPFREPLQEAMGAFHWTDNRGVEDLLKEVFDSLLNFESPAHLFTTQHFPRLDRQRIRGLPRNLSDADCVKLDLTFMNLYGKVLLALANVGFRKVVEQEGNFDYILVSLRADGALILKRLL